MHQCVAGMVLKAISLYFLPSIIKYENVHYSSLSSFLTARDGNRMQTSYYSRLKKTHGMNHDIPRLEKHSPCLFNFVPTSGRLQ